MKYPPNYHFMDQHESSWFAARCGSVTASKVKCVVRRQKNGKYYAARADYMAEKFAESLTGEAADHVVTGPMIYGIEHERLAIANYEFAMGVDTDPIGYISHPTIKFAGASPDRLLGDDGVVEVKVPNTRTHLEYLEAGKVPDEYLHQCAWQLACSGRSFVDFVSFDPRLNEDFGLFIVRYERDDELIAQMEEEVLKFLGELGTMAQRLMQRKGEHKASIAHLPEEPSADGPVRATIPDVNAWLESK